MSMVPLTKCNPVFQRFHMCVAFLSQCLLRFSVPETLFLGGGEVGAGIGTVGHVCVWGSGDAEDGGRREGGLVGYVFDWENKGGLGKCGAVVGLYTDSEYTGVKGYCR